MESWRIRRSLTTIGIEEDSTGSRKKIEVFRYRLGHESRGNHAERGKTNEREKEGTEMMVKD